MLLYDGATGFEHPSYREYFDLLHSGYEMEETVVSTFGMDKYQRLVSKGHLKPAGTDSLGRPYYAKDAVRSHSQFQQHGKPEVGCCKCCGHCPDPSASNFPQHRGTVQRQGISVQKGYGTRQEGGYGGSSMTNSSTPVSMVGNFWTFDGVAELVGDMKAKRLFDNRQLVPFTADEDGTFWFKESDVYKATGLRPASPRLEAAARQLEKGFKEYKRNKGLHLKLSTILKSSLGELVQNHGLSAAAAEELQRLRKDQVLRAIRQLKTDDNKVDGRMLSATLGVTVDEVQAIWDALVSQNLVQHLTLVKNWPASPKLVSSVRKLQQLAEQYRAKNSRQDALAFALSESLAVLRRNHPDAVARAIREMEEDVSSSEEKSRRRGR